MNLAARIPRRVLPQGLALHILLEAAEAGGEELPLQIDIIPHDQPEGAPPQSPSIELFDLPSDHYATALSLETSNMAPGEYLAVVSSQIEGVVAEECFWILDHASYKAMLDEIQDEEFDFLLRIERSGLLALLRKKLIESDDQAVPVQAPEGLWERNISLNTKTSADFVSGGTLPIAKINFGFDCLLEDFMYLNVFSNLSGADEAGEPGRSIYLNVNETGDVAVDAIAVLAVPLFPESIQMFRQHSAIAQASAKWPEFFEASLDVTPGHFHLRFTISRILRGRPVPESSAIPHEGAASPVAEWAFAEQSGQAVKEEEEVARALENAEDALAMLESMQRGW